MKIIIQNKDFVFVILLSLFLSSNLFGQQKQNGPASTVIINIQAQKISLAECFKKLETATGYQFVYSSKEVDANEPTGLNFVKQSLAQVLSKLGEKHHLSFKIINKQIAVNRSQINIGPSHLVTGEVIDSATHETIIGASVHLKSNQTGVLTDVSGRFSLNAGYGDELMVSYIGYKNQSVTITQDHLVITLAGKQSALSEVVVVGYGVQKKRDVTGSVVSITADDIKQIPATNPFQAIKGKAAGVDVFNGGNEPGAAINIQIRGQNSINVNNPPLVVLDGIPAIDGFINDINPSDIQSIEVLKDASATAIYGSRASNGVLLITTKRGSTGKTNISYDSYYGVTSTINRLDLMNGAQFAQLRREANRTDDPKGAYPQDKDIFDNIALESIAKGRSTDWQDVIYGNGNKQNHQLSVNGGGEKTQFALSTNYFKENGIVDKSDYTRGSFRINVDHHINDKFKAGISSFASRSIQHVPSGDVFDNALRLNPLGVPYDDQGNLLFRPNNDEGQRVNPLYDINGSLDERYQTRVFASIYGEYKISPSLSYHLNVGPDAEFANGGTFNGSLTTANQGGSSTAGVNETNIFSITVENILNYDKRFGTDHHITATAVQSYQNQVTNSSFTNVSKLPYESQTYHNLATAGSVTGVGSDYQKWSLLSYMGRINYQYKDRYLLTITGRADGSSRFAEGHKWGFFPSAALAWKMSDEDFLKSSKLVSTLKLRTSYGSTGNTGIQPYKTFGVLQKTTYTFGDTGAPGFLPGTISNPNLKWETTNQINAAVDFGFWNDRLTGTVEYYQSKTHDILLNRSIPTSTGFVDVLENIGSTKNDGIEVSLSSVNIASSHNGFRWRTDINFSKNNNKITELMGDGKDVVGNGWFIGHPIKVFYDYKKIGIWQTSEAAEAKANGFAVGGIKIEDTNHDGKYDANDRQILGSYTPAWIGGLTNTFSYRGFDLSVVLNTRQNYLTYSQWYDNNNRLAGRYNNLNVNYWTPENPTNDNPRPDKNQEGVFLGSTLAYKDVSFVRVKNINFTYHFPLAWIKKLQMSALSLTVSAENPFTITDYKGYDPEFESTGQRALYPSTKMYAVGLNASF
ncbi:MAG: TonB-dependent receptor [Mucilaginibacter sp.]|uniref:TonB-dependent receptor n=1 Tax=Mucilaginibacter sp. TaxID=1882438 RepID=UPI0031A3C8A4